MKRTIASAAALLSFAIHASALTLSQGTLADYLALGPGGGTIGTTLFSNFSLLPIQNGAMAITPSLILITPIDLFGSPTLQFDLLDRGGNFASGSSGAFLAFGGELFEMRIGYTVSALSITGAGVGLANASATGGGAVTAQLGITGPVPPPGTLAALETSFISIPADQAAFAPVTSLAVESDIVVDGGPGGQNGLASGGRVSNRFSVAGVISVPDGGTTLVLLAGGLFGLAVLRRWLAVDGGA